MAAGTTDRISSTLPTQATGFVGRRRELAQLEGALRDARLVTVTGVGGVGKTRLAVQAAAQASERYPDGVFLVELSGAARPGLLAATVASCLGLPAQDDRAQLDALLDYLRDRTLLLILDTCEHLVDACAMLADAVLREAPGVTILATSRQPLAVAGEHTFLLPPLPVPDAATSRARARDAVELFAQRAAAVVARVHRHRRQPRGRHRALPRARRHPAGDRAGRGAAAGAAARRDGRAPRRPLPGAHRGQAGRGGAAPHAARGDRVELRAVHARRAAAVGAAVGVRRDLRPRRRRRVCAGGELPRAEIVRGAGRPGGEVRSVARAIRAGADGAPAHRVPDARHHPPVRRGPPGRHQRRGGRAEPSGRALPRPGAAMGPRPDATISSRSTARSTASTPTCGPPWSTRST